MVITFDFDDTLLWKAVVRDEDGSYVEHNPIGQNPYVFPRLLEALDGGNEVHIVTSRRSKTKDEVMGWLDVWRKHNPQLSRLAGVHFTEGQLKRDALARLGSQLHFDDDPEELAHLPEGCRGIRAPLHPSWTGQLGEGRYIESSRSVEMRRMRLVGQNERLLREAVRGMIVEEAPNSGIHNVAEIAEFALIKPDFALSGPISMGAVGGVFFPDTGIISSVRAQTPFLVVARKGSNDLNASAYLLMFEDNRQASLFAQSVQQDLLYPPSCRVPTNEEILQIYLDKSWTSIPRAVMTPDTTDPMLLSRFRVMEELPKDSPNPVLQDRRSGRLSLIELELHKRLSDSPGRQKIWRVFGEVAPTSAIDLIVAGVSVASDVLGASAEAIDQAYIARLAAGPGPAKLGAAILQLIKSGNIYWGAASIVGAATSLVASAVDLRRITRAESLNPYAGRSGRLAVAKAKVLLNAVSLVLGVAAAACDAITTAVRNKKGPGVAATVEKAIRISKIITTIIGAGMGTADAVSFYNLDVLAKLKLFKEEILATIEGIKHDPSKLGVDRTDLVVEALDMLVADLNKD